MRAARALLALLALGLAAPAPARALATASVDPAIRAPVAQEIRADLALAERYWGAAPDCPGGIQVIRDDTQVGATGGWAQGEEAPGLAIGCRIWVGAGFMDDGANPDNYRCTSVVHEWGHLLGHDHVPSGDPDNVMPYLDAGGSVMPPDTPPSIFVHVNRPWVCYLPRKGVARSARRYRRLWGDRAVRRWQVRQVARRLRATA